MHLGNRSSGVQEFKEFKEFKDVLLKSKKKLGGKKYRMRIGVLARGIAMSPLLNSCNSLNS
jgi:hypothetical protein